jgi:uncharacterized protein YqiB (DUF1249 family)
MSRFLPRNRSYWLAKLCEANYERLVALVPDLDQIRPALKASVHGKPALHIRLLERSPYTLTLELTHAFNRAMEELREPAVRIRVYLDARSVEVLSDHCRPEVRDALRDEATPQRVLDYKWSLNYFLARWLDYCVASRYRLASGPADLYPWLDSSAPA